jgi:hypothetical protein
MGIKKVLTCLEYAIERAKKSPKVKRGLLENLEAWLE